LDIGDSIYMHEKFNVCGIYYIAVGVSNVMRIFPNFVDSFDATFVEPSFVFLSRSAMLERD